MTRKPILPLPLAISAAQISAELATALERVSVTVSLDGVRRMLVKAAHEIATGREDLEGLLKAAGRLMDHFEPGRAEGVAAPQKAAQVPSVGSEWKRRGGLKTWRVESVGRLIVLAHGDNGFIEESFVSVMDWPGEWVPA
jgi:hypothetical protein